MNDERYVAAIEISSSKIVAVAGRMNSDGQLDILASEQERGVESVRHGIIQNLEETAMRVTRVIDRLQRNPRISPREITGLYVGLSGRSLRSIAAKGEVNLPDDTEITEDILIQLRNQVLGTAIDTSLEVVDAVPRIYTVGKLETTSPKGAIGNCIKGIFDLIVCRPELRRNLSRTITDKVGIPICGYVVTALSTAQVLLTTEEKRLGCMLVDMGAETTTVSIYKDGYLRYFATLPLGGRNITRDLTSLSPLLEERAEEIKIQFGNALLRETSTALNVHNVRMSDISNLIVARSEEIVANIVEQINYAGLKDRDLPGGLICIGGASKLNGMFDLLQRQTDLPVRKGQLPNYIFLEDNKTPISEIIEATSVLYSGATATDDECLELPGSEELPVTGESQQTNERDKDISRKQPRKEKNKNRFWSSLTDKVSQIFSGADEDDSDLLE